MSKWLEGKAAIITEAGRGIGRATAQLLASEGARVLASDLDAEPLTETVAEIQAAGGLAQALAGDIIDPAFPARLVETD